MTPEEFQAINEGAIVKHKSGKTYRADDVRIGSAHKLVRFAEVQGPGQTSFGNLRSLKPESLTLVSNPPPPPKDFMSRVRAGDFNVTLPRTGKDAEERTRSLKEYRAACVAKEAEFKAALYEYCGVTNNPKADKAFELAKDYAHGEGRSAVVTRFEELVELIT